MLRDYAVELLRVLLKSLQWIAAHLANESFHSLTHALDADAGSRDQLVDLCRLQIGRQSEFPHAIPAFDDLDALTLSGDE